MRDERHVDAECFGVRAVAELAHGFQEGKAFDVADGAADFADAEVFVVESVEEEFLDGVGDMRHDLDGGAEVVSAAFARDDFGVYFAGGHAVAGLGGDAGEAFVVSEVQVGFGAVVGDEDFAVFEGVHRAGVDIEVGVKFAEAHGVAVCLEEGAEGG